jgi:hypothetical protein
MALRKNNFNKYLLYPTIFQMYKIGKSAEHIPFNSVTLQRKHFGKCFVTRPEDLM